MRNWGQLSREAVACGQSLRDLMSQSSFKRTPDCTVHLKGNAGKRKREQE